MERGREGRAKIWGLTGLGLLLGLLLLPRFAMGEDAVEYEIDARIEKGGTGIHGTVSVSFTNGAATPLDHLLFLLHGRKFSQPDPELSDLIFDRTYPRGFSAGNLEWVDAVDEDGNPLPPGQTLSKPLGAEGPPLRCFWAQPLLQPLLPGESITLLIAFRTQIPERYGTFGRVKERLTATGGWFPMVAPRDGEGRWTPSEPAPTARMAAAVVAPPGWQILLNGQGQEQRVVWTGRAPHLSLVAGPKLPFRDRMTEGGGYRYYYLGLPPSRDEWKDLDGVIGASLLTLSQLAPGHPSVPLRVVEAPLRARLTEPSEGMVLVSDWLFHATPVARVFEEPYLAQAVMQERIASVVREAERSFLAPLLAEGVSFWLLPRFRKVRNPLLPPQELVRPLGVLPDSDSLLTSPPFPFADEFVNNAFAWDPLRDDVTRYTHSRMGGRVIFHKLESQVGSASLRSATEAYVTSLLASGVTIPFLSLLQSRTGASVLDLVEEWNRPHPFIDYSVQKVRRGRDEEGPFSKVTVRRDVLGQDTLPTDRVPLRIRLLAPPGRRTPTVWLSWEGKGQGEERTITLREELRHVQEVAVDPRGTVLEVDEDRVSLRTNNRMPRMLALSPFVGILSVDVTSGDFDGYAGVLLRRHRETRQAIYVELSHSPEILVGLGVGYNRYFGKKTDGSFRRNRVSVLLEASLLNARYAQIFSNPFSVGGQLGYLFESRRSALFPTRGFRFSLVAFGGYDVSRDDASLGEPGDYLGIQAEAVGMARLHPDQVLALRGKAGWMRGQLEHRQFSLGGADDLRGLPAGFARGTGKIFAALEWRHVFFRDVDIPLPLGRLRGMQGTLFAEAGWVGNKDPLPQEWRYGLGYGLRFYVAGFGVLPLMGGFDVAWSPWAPEGNLLPIPVQLYLVAGQTF